MPTKNIYLSPLSTSYPRQQSGLALIEFALVLPVLVIMLVGTLEYSRVFYIKEMMTIATQEAAKLAYRNCYDGLEAECPLAPDPNPGNSPISAQDMCLNNYAFAINQTLSGWVGSVELTLSMYEWEPGGAGGGTVALYAITKDVPSGDPTTTKFSETRVTNEFLDLNGNSIVQNQQFVVISEVFVEHEWFTFDLGPNLRLYDVTVF